MGPEGAEEGGDALGGGGGGAGPVEGRYVTDWSQSMIRPGTKEEQNTETASRNAHFWTKGGRSMRAEDRQFQYVEKRVAAGS